MNMRLVKTQISLRETKSNQGLHPPSVEILPFLNKMGSLHRTKILDMIIAQFYESTRLYT